jgi:hypothetical protein
MLKTSAISEKLINTAEIKDDHQLLLFTAREGNQPLGVT